MSRSAHATRWIIRRPNGGGGWLPLRWLGVVLLALIVTLPGCATSEAAWESRELVEHPLVGRIWDGADEQFVTAETLVAAAATADVVLLGEVHHNPDHQRLQEEIITALLDQGRQPALVFEMLERDVQPVVDQVVTRAQPTTDALAAATNFAASGWDWAAYEPLFALALQHDLPILAGNAPRTEVRQVAQAGLNVLAVERQQALGLADPLPPPAQAALIAEIVAGHCGYLTPEQAEPLAAAQRLRDATMADVILGATGDPVVLIAGRGHVRTDYGIPRYLHQRQPGIETLAVALVEVRAEAEQVAAYLEAEAVGPPGVFAYRWFTPRVTMDDPCEAFRESLEQMEPEREP